MGRVESQESGVRNQASGVRSPRSRIRNEKQESQVETMISPPILWPTGQRIPGVDANAYIQRSFERLSGWPTRWPTGQRMIYPPIRKKPVCVSGRNAIQIQSKSILGGCPG